MSKIYDEVQGAGGQKCPSKYKKDDEGMHTVVKYRLATTEKLLIEKLPSNEIELRKEVPNKVRTSLKLKALLDVAYRIS